MKVTFNRPITGQKRDVDLNKRFVTFKQSLDVDTFVPSDKIQVAPSFKGFCDYLCGKPLMLFWNPHSSDSLDHIVEQNDAMLARKLVENGSLNNFPKVREYLVERIVKGIDETGEYLEKVDVLKALNAVPELIQLGLEKQQPIYNKLIDQLQGMPSLFK